MKKILLILTLWGIALAALPQEMLPVWTKSFGGPEWDIANTMCISPTGDVIVSGTFSDSITINGELFYSNGFTDVFVAKYDKEGSPLGAFIFGGKGNDRANFSGYGNNLVLLTQFQNPFEINGMRIDSTGLVNYMTGWFDEKGSLLNHNTISCTGNLQISNMNSDSDGTVYLTGWYTDTLRIDGKLTGISITEAPLLLTMQDKGKSQEIKTISELKNRQVYACTNDAGNKMLITGITTDENDKDLSNPAVVYHSLFTATMNQGGKISDMRNIIRGIDIQPVSIVTAKQSTWIAARFKYYCLNGTDTLKAKGQNDILLVKIPEKKEDIQIWTIGGYAEDMPLYLKASGNQAILTGSYSDTIWFGENNIMVANELGSDLFMAIFDDEKTPVKTISIGGLYNDFPCAMATSDAGVYVLGQFRDTLVIGGSKIGTEGSYDVFLSRFENCGAKAPVEIFAEASKKGKGNTEYQLRVGEGYTSYHWSDGLGFGTTANVDKAKKYSIEAIDLFGCKCTGEIDLASLKSALIGQENNQISNAQQAEFKLYPTVTEGTVYWQPGNKFPATGANLSVVDAKGSTIIRKVYSSSLDPLSVQTLNMGQLIPGQYLIKITGEGYKESVKVIVK